MSIEFVECSNCGVMFNPYEGESYNIGKSIKWMCPECMKYGNHEADSRLMAHNEQIRRRINKDKSK